METFPLVYFLSITVEESFPKSSGYDDYFTNKQKHSSAFVFSLVSSADSWAEVKKFDFLFNY